MKRLSSWVKPLLSLLILFLVIEFTAFPWRVLSLQKLFLIIIVLILIQVISLTLTRFLGAKAGAILGGFLGGLISSTAATVSTARNSKNLSHKIVVTETMAFVSATLAMLVEGLIIFLISEERVHLSLVPIFIFPLLTSILILFWLSKKVNANEIKTSKVRIDLSAILKLSLFIFLALWLSKFLQNILGQAGLLILTFLISLFEIHGSIFANIQLHNAGAFNSQFLGILFATSLASSYIAKLFLIYALGSKELKTRSSQFLILILPSLAMGLLLSLYLESA